jgi:imidazolonepropionase
VERLTIFNARLITLDPGGAPEGPRRGRWLRDLGVIDRGWLSIDHGRILGLGSGDPPPGVERAIDAGGRVLMPAFVDCHTHACWAGERYGEFAMRLAGRSYLEILEAGGGIMSTVRAVRRASEGQLARNLRHRLEQMHRGGTGAIEVKSGYGLSTADELKMLRAIAAVAETSPAPVVATFLGAHAIDRETPDFVDRTIGETLPAVAAAFPGIACDAYCEQGAWSVESCVRLFEKAKALGLPIRVHLDQFNALGMLPIAIELGARTVDHLEASAPADLDRLAASDTIAVLLPASGFSLDDRYADARRLIDAGGAVAIASNCNPGSAPGPSIAFAASLGCRKLRMTPEEVIVATTVNAAHAIGLGDSCGRLAPGLRADLQLLDADDERAIGGEYAIPGPAAIALGGRWFGLIPDGLA